MALDLVLQVGNLLSSKAKYKDFGTRGFELFPMMRECLQLTYEQVPVTDLLTQSLEDSLSGLKHHFDSHQFFHDYKRLQVMFFPSRMIETDRFRHIAHLEPDSVLRYSKLGHKQLFYELRSRR